MTEQNRMNVFPTSMNLIIMKNGLLSAKKGHYLLKKMADSLKLQKRKLEEKLKDETENIKAQVIEAHLALSEAKYRSNDIRSFVHNCSKFPVELVTSKTHISGLTMIAFELRTLTTAKATCLGKGGVTLLNAREKFIEVLKKILYLHSIKTSHDKIEHALKATNRRVNSLDSFVIPRYENTIVYIADELDEQGREEFFRLKKIQQKKEDKKRELDDL
ncbi:putative V-type proton ATPase subunit D 2 [Cucumispora dikerogammari]|nr:putative V-type proton ATPase subunit D 2 [Cucumispora dikerogammari]